ncbi:MAG: TIGR02996 domain-containing protein [Myxococcales bacterium]|nr:TIGR02996 domain-containing protein [Myxococcales bacterium]
MGTAGALVYCTRRLQASRSGSGLALARGNAIQCKQEARSDARRDSLVAAARNPELEQQIIAAPDDVQAYLVYGDWLQARGDPRGALIAAQHALLDDPESPPLRETERLLIEEHARELGGPTLDVEPAPQMRWQLGFWRALRCGSFGWSAKPWHDEHVQALLEHDSARFVRELAADGLFTGAVLATVGDKHQTLRSLDVALRAGEQFDDDSLAPLRACTRLRRLALFSCDAVTDRGMQVLRALDELEQIDLRNHPLSDAGVACLSAAPLQEVFFNELARGFSSAGMAGLARLPLRKLDLSCGPSIGDEHLRQLAGHATIDDLALPGAGFGEQGARALATLALARLYVPSSAIGDAGVAQLPRCLRSVDLGHCRLSDAACAALACMADLEQLRLDGSAGVTGGGVRQLAALGRLRTLCLGFCELDDQDIEPLGDLESIETLGLAFNNLTEASVDMLARMPRLHTLDLASCALSEDAIDRLARSASLRYVGLYSCPSEAIARAEGVDGWSVYRRDTLELMD